MQGRCQRAQVHFWPIAIEVDGHCSASFLNFFKNVCNASKDLTEQNPQAFKQYWWKRIACELHKMNAKLALQLSVEVVATGLNVPCGTLSALRVAPEVREVSPASVALLHSAAK